MRHTLILVVGSIDGGKESNLGVSEDTEWLKCGTLQFMAECVVRIYLNLVHNDLFELDGARKLVVDNLKIIKCLGSVQAVRNLTIRADFFFV